MDAIATRSRLITKRQLGTALFKLLNQLVQGFGGVGDLTYITQLTAMGIRNRNRNRFFMHVQPHILAKLFHDLPPQFRLCACCWKNFKRNPRRLRCGRSIHHV